MPGSKPSYSLHTTALAGLLSVIMPHYASAWEPNDVADRFKSLLQKQGVSAVWDGVERQGDSILLQDVAFGIEENKKARFALGNLLLEDISESDTGYEVGRFALDPLEVDRDGLALSLQGFLVNGMILPDPENPGPYGDMLQFRRFEVDHFSVGTEGSEPIFSLQDFLSETRVDENTKNLTFEGGVKSLSLNLADMVDNGKATAALAELGYEKLTGSMEMSGSWQVQEGRLELDMSRFNVDNAGSINLKTDIGGYTPEVVKALQDVQQTMSSGDEAARQAQGLAMLGLMQQLVLNGASIRLEDASLTEKILGYVAKQQGTKPANVASQAKAIVPLLAGQYLGPELTQSLSKAITTFLDDPKSLEIRLSPSEPVPFALLAGVAMSSPEALAKQVGLGVLANSE